jgi:hypothetical protein
LAAATRGTVAAVALLAGVALALLFGTAARSQVTIPTLPGATTTTVAPEPTPTTEATTTTAPPQTTETTVLPGGEIVEVPAPVDTVPALTGPSSSTPPTTTRATARVTTTRAALVCAVSPAAVAGSFGIGVAAIVGFALVLIAFATRVRQGGPHMTDSRRNRLYTGVGLLALAAIVGLVGYLKLSLEPDVNRQIPYLASAGMALVLLSAAGGALIVGEQLRADDRRIEELEAAVLALSGVLSPTIEAPARRAEPTIEVVETAVAPRPARKPRATKKR